MAGTRFINFLWHLETFLFPPILGAEINSRIKGLPRPLGIRTSALFRRVEPGHDHVPHDNSVNHSTDLSPPEHQPFDLKNFFFFSSLVSSHSSLSESSSSLLRNISLLQGSLPSVKLLPCRLYDCTPFAAHLVLLLSNY